MAGDHWISENDLATLTRLLEGQRVVDGRADPLTPPASIRKVELFIGIDDDGKRFLVKNPAHPVDAKVLAPSAGSASTTVRAPVAVAASGELAAHRVRGCFLAGAVGDALGAPIESDSIERIRERFGPRGLTDFMRAYEGIGTITDDTQMTLATADAIIRAHSGLRRGAKIDAHYELQMAYQRWLHTQGVPWERARGPQDHTDRPDGWLLTHRDLFHRRAPGATCFFALKGFAQTGEMATFSRAVNNSKGCGGVMRAAPIALWSDDPAAVFELASVSAALTHSHPSGYLSAGAFAVIIQQLLRDVPLLPAIEVAKAQLAKWAGHEEQTAALDQAVQLAQQGPPTPEKVATLGGGNVGETALAIGVYATLTANSVDEALFIAVNHSGDSDSTGSIAGNLAGAIHGEQAIRASWLDRLELRDVIAQVADDLRAEFGPTPPSGEEWLRRYPVPALTSDQGISLSSRFRGSLLAGAIGDALGAATEFDSIDRIREIAGPDGITDFIEAYGGIGKITDDTQMTMFTLEGLIRARINGGDAVHALQMAYQRWLHTQGILWHRARGPANTSEEPDGWLITVAGLFSRRAPGLTCFGELEAYGRTGIRSSTERPVNNSKGCGGVMRVAPIGLWSDDPAEVFRLGAESAALTHGHPSGYLSSGTFAVIVQQLLAGVPLRQAVDVAIKELVKHPMHEEQLTALDQALKLTGPPTPERLESLGQGNIGETALSMSVYVALNTDDPDSALLASVNHSGDSDSTGSVCGNLVGAMYGEEALRTEWLNRLELREALEILADDALAEFGVGTKSDDRRVSRYPAD